ncbi:family 88 glycosyl hydrolase [Gymnopus androsaceus JB14]|uniref:Family 88 glycosyl hydrolase n=1 Tax=Gymnopus androsaceus JB14 TaxID=1447944 RepID=A0A6A4HM89_9AGAR|nr:family 88 glycosyl hydrolase [Gymnopus androsaceus JB14]
MLALVTLFLAISTRQVASQSSDPFPFNPGFDIEAVAAIAKALPSHSWEFGTATEALLELYNSSYSVFGTSPFPIPALNPDDVPALAYAAENIVLGTGADGLADGDGAVGDPASLGVGAVLLGKTNSSFAAGAANEFSYITGSAPQWYNGAISQRTDVPELWADFMYMAPPFLAYYAVDTANTTLLRQAVDQSRFYRQALQANISSSVSYSGLWEHIVGPQSADLGLWSTGNGWAGAGMTRILATVMNAPPALTLGWKDEAVSNLTTWIQEIVDGAIGSPMDGGLLRNYLNDTSGDGLGYGETSGSSLLASVAYRMATLQPQTFGSKYVQWADDIRITLGGNDADGNPHVTSNGTVTPSVNPLDWTDTTPYTAGSPEGQNFVVLMYAAWRDCILASICSESGGVSKRGSIAKFRI